jgi:predicted dehydrogenase
MTERDYDAPIRVGIIGLGFAGETALKGFWRLPQVHVLALAGLENDRLASLGKAYEVPHLYHSYEELLACEGLDAVSIGVPNALHAPIALAALERGLHVLCEKPLASTIEDAERMVQAAHKANRVLQVVFNHRERADVQLLKQYIDDGVLGKIYYAKAYWMRRKGIPGLGSWFVNKKLSGGGSLIDLGIHVLDIALYLLGEPLAVTVSASTYQELGSNGIGFNKAEQKYGTEHAFDVEDLASAFIRLVDGATLFLETSWATHSGAQDDYGVILYGTRGGADIHVRNHTTEKTLTVYTNQADVPVDIYPQTRGGEFHAGVTRRFIEQIRSGNWTGLHGTEALRRSRIIDACYRSAIEKREVPIERDGSLL